MDKNRYTQKILEAEGILYRVAKTLLDSEKDCEDAVQEAILKSYEKRSTLREERFFQTWLVRILINECYSIRRRRKPTVSYEDYMEQEAVEEKDYSELYHALWEIPEAIWITMVLYYLEGYALKEIKIILKIPEGTVKSRLSKGRKLLKARLESEEA